MKTNFMTKNKIWQRYLPILFLFILTISLTSCYTDYGLTSADYDIVVTQYDKTTDFNSLKTFSLIDSVFHITGDDDEPDSEFLTRKNDALIISTVRTNMINLGYQEVTNPTDQNVPAVVITIRALGTKIDQYYAYGYYPGWGYPGWGYGWGGYYPPYIGSTTYYVGTIFLDYFDVAASESADEYVVPWYATINGLLAQGQTEQRLVSTINQSFNQSPYLKVN